MDEMKSDLRIPFPRYRARSPLTLAYFFSYTRIHSHASSIAPSLILTQPSLDFLWFPHAGRRGPRRLTHPHTHSIAPSLLSHPLSPLKHTLILTPPPLSLPLSLPPSLPPSSRSPIQGDEAPEDLSLCPVSQQMIPLTQLECPTTRDALPMCVITGR